MAVARRSANLPLRASWRARSPQINFRQQQQKTQRVNNGSCDGVVVNRAYGLMPFLSRARRLTFPESVFFDPQTGATIEALNASERAVLAKHLDKNDTTLNWPSDRSEIASLVHKGILHRIESTSAFGVPFVVDSQVWQYLLKNKGQFVEDTDKTAKE